MKSNNENNASPNSINKFHQRSNSIGTRTVHTTSSGQNGEDEQSVSSGGSEAGYHTLRISQNLTLSALLESVLCGLEEPRGTV